MKCQDLDVRYYEAIDYLFSRLPMFSRVGGAAYKPGLERVLKLAEYFGNPHHRLKAIHIAGTNGKGSTSHILSAILQSEGYRTALYTSPHLVDFRERIRIDGKMIPKERVIRFVDQWKEIEQDYEGDAPSFFELTMMLAFVWFAEEGVDYAVIETGMGGRLDSTNILTPLLSIITNISFDHRMFLGDTLEAIAGEKAGIIKRGVPVVIGEAEGEVRNVFAEKGAEMGSPIYFASETPAAFNSKSDIIDGWTGWSNVCGKWHTPLTGAYQKHNVNTVLKSIEVLRNLGICLSDYAVRTGLSQVERLTGFTGRFTILNRTPLIICDTGHNEAGLHYNNQQLRQLLSMRSGARLHYVVGFVSDKEVDHILGEFLPEATYYVTQASVPRAMKSEVLYEKFISFGFEATRYDTVAEAFKAASKNAAHDDIIFVGGSTFVVADFLRDNPLS